ncbi:subtilase [Colletotrichum tamarilloi]|uniref:Subtilase n=1 Tax=Colletotrichum tamarilloi TaxID=1209934 RepID=A0ABQ9QIP6_9PEZI|nr:subtilase [Colletotrichum tamarilloi]KAK1471851.1 subtilase [Colletotrichum tamarilloi]
MPPKKIEVVKDNVVAFGRVSKNLKMGCVGLPNVGKSSLFNLLTEQSAAAENYPFCTIEPNEARCAVPDARYDFLCDLWKPPSMYPAYLQVTDIAGLIKVNMSLGGPASTAWTTAINAAYNSGVTTVVAAGNEAQNAANVSPANAANAITVGAITSTWAIASYSNYGTSLDIFAPGSSILSTWYTSTTATNTISGTSMASPHVAGLVNYLQSVEGLSTPASIVARIKALGTSGKITGTLNSSPNLVAYNGNGA